VKGAYAVKKLKFIGLIILLLLPIEAISCTSQDNSKTTANNTIEKNKNNTENDTSKKYQNTPEAQKILEANQREDNEKDNTNIDKRYRYLDKSKLDYNNGYSSNTYYETKESFVGSEAGIPKINNKKYMEILKDYTYASEVNPTKIPYSEAVKLAKSILPDDIKEVQKKYDKDTSTTYVSYSSSKGNFVVGFSYDYDHSQASGFNPNSDNEIIVGIHYLKQIS
jgi:hypothetical protein